VSPRARRERRQQARAATRAGQAPPAASAAWRPGPDAVVVALLLFAVGLRLHYFVLTKDQPLWWDEAEYMLKAKALVFGTPETGWWQARPILLSFFAAGLMYVGLGETAIRLVWLLLSAGTLALIYGIAATLFDRWIGVLAVALAVVSYIDVFYAMRLLVDGPQVFFATLAAWLLASALHGGGRYAAWGVVPALAVGTALRFTAAIFAPIAAAFLFAVKGRAALRERAWWISLGLGALLVSPMLVYFQRLYGNPFRPFFSHMVLRGPLATTASTTRPAEVFLEYVRYFPEYTTPLVTALFTVGFVLAAVRLARGLRRLREDRLVQGDLLLLLWIVVPFAFFGFFVNTFQDRFLIIIFPAVFLVTGAALRTAYGLVRRRSPAAGIAGVAAIVLLSGAEMAWHTDAVVREKIASYRGVADAGLWLRRNTPAGAVVLSASVTQNTYYAERPTYDIAGSEAELVAQIRDRAATHMVLSVWERSAEWVYAWPAKNPDKVSVAAAFYLDETRRQPSAVVYAFKPASK
jgi:4-amino-4-deoxy-L-arabinose transferase-like glycosyltransferase